MEGRCFSYSDGRLSWKQARDSCLAIGGRLAEIDSEAINRTLTAFVDGLYFLMK